MRAPALLRKARIKKIESKRVIARFRECRTHAYARTKRARAYTSATRTEAWGLRPSAFCGIMPAGAIKNFAK